VKSAENADEGRNVHACTTGQIDDHVRKEMSAHAPFVCSLKWASGAASAVLPPVDKMFSVAAFFDADKCKFFIIYFFLK
jgi:hypothetical protein